jgi:transcriptional regulator with XRE-family HTH domain
MSRSTAVRKKEVEVDDSEQAVAQLAARIRQLRAHTGMTLEQLAQRSGVSRAMLSKVERGEKSPTLPVIVRIAGGFNMSLSAFLGAEPDPSDVAIIRHAKRLTFKDPETGFERAVLSPAHLDNGVEVVLHRIPPGESSGVLPAYSVPTEKYLVVHEGKLTVYVDNKPHQLSTGDAMYFEVKGPYSLVNEGEKPCAYYMVIVRKR